MSFDHRFERLTPMWAKFFLRRVRPGEELRCNHRTCDAAVAWVWSFGTARANKCVRRSLLLCEEHKRQAERENMGPVAAKAFER